MNPLRRAWHAVKQTASRFGMAFAGSRSSWGSAWLGLTRRDYASAVGDGRGNAIVRACTKWMARTFPEAPAVVQIRNAERQWEPAEDHALASLLARPNRAYSGVHLWAATIADWAFGNAYWLKVRSRAGGVVELWWVPSWAIEPAWDQEGLEFITHYEYNPGNRLRPIEIPPADVVHFRNGFDPQNIRKGESDLTALLREVYTDDEAANYTASMLSNLGVPGVVISPAVVADKYEPMTQEDAERTKARFQASFTSDHRGEPLVMGAATRIERLSFNPSEMALRDLRRIPEERVSAIFGTPAVVVGLGAGLDRSTFANFSEAREAAYESNIIPTQRLMAAELQTQLVPDFGDPATLRVAFDLTQVRVLQEDANALASRQASLVAAGLKTINEARASLGEEGLDGGDVLLVPVGVTPTDPALLLALPEPAAADPAVLPPPAELRGLPAPATKAAEPADGLPDDIAPVLLAAFVEVAEAAAERLPEVQGAKSANGHGGVALETKATAIPGLVTLEDHADIDRLLRSYLLKSMRAAQEELGEPAPRITRASRAYKEAVAAYEPRLAGMVDTTADDFGGLVRRLQERPGSVPIEQVQQAIRDYVAETYPGRAELIARTEAGYGRAAGVVHVARATGADRVVVTDGDGDDACRAVNGAEWTLEQYQANPLGHPNCRRRARLVRDDDRR